MGSRPADCWGAVPEHPAIQRPGYPDREQSQAIRCRKDPTIFTTMDTEQAGGLRHGPTGNGNESGGPMTRVVDPNDSPPLPRLTQHVGQSGSPSFWRRVAIPALRTCPP